MKTLKIFSLLLVFPALLLAQDATSIMKEAHLNYYYAGDDGKAKVEMELVDANGNTKTKALSMSRKDVKDGGDQNYFIYFSAPSDIKRMTFMVQKHVGKDDDRMLYVPSIDLVKKIAASDKASSFVGSDFTYEDVSGRIWTLDNHELLGEEEIAGVAAFKIKSTPKENDYFGHKISFVSKENKLPVREEFYTDSGELERVFTAEKIETIEGFPTITVRKMENVQKGQYTQINFESIKYNIGVKDRYFSERYLKKPHISLR